MAQSHEEQATVEAAEESGMHPAILASAASVMLSWYMFFVRGDRERGIFIGLWPPTFLAFASYFEQARMHNTIKHLTGQRLMNRIEKILPSQ